LPKQSCQEEIPVGP